MFYKTIKIFLLLMMVLLSGCVTENTSSDSVNISEFDLFELLDIPTSRTRIAVLPVNSVFLNSEESDALRLIIEEKIQNIENYVLVDNENVSEIIKQQEASINGYYDDEYAIEIAKLVFAKTIVLSKITILDGVYIFNIKILNVETGEIIKSKNIHGGTIADLVKIIAPEFTGIQRSDDSGKSDSTITTKNINSASMFGQSFRVNENLTQYSNYQLFAEDDKNDFTKEASFGVSEDPAGDIKSLVYYVDNNYYYFMVDTWTQLSLSEINVCFNFYFNNIDEYDVIQIHCNNGTSDSHFTIGTEIMGQDYIPMEIDEDIRYRFDKEYEIRIPKSLFKELPNSLLVQTRTQRAKEIDRLIIEFNR